MLNLANSVNVEQHRAKHNEHKHTMYIDKIPEDAVLISGARDYIDPRGNVYGIERRHRNKNAGRPFIKSLHEVYGYCYCAINYEDGRHISKRVHRLVAEAFIPNPNNYPIVMHLDNNKKNNCVDNLKWGTISENTQQAVDDNLLVNDKGFDDSQSIPCDCYDTLTNKLIGSFGSVTIAAKETDITVCGIMYQLKNPDKPIRKKVYFVPFGDGSRTHEIVCRYDYNTDNEIERYVNCGHASKETGIPLSTISDQVRSNAKPNCSKYNCYFKQVTVC